MKKLIDEIRKVGLNDYEARSYLHLLRLSTAKVSDLAYLASIPRARIYDVLVGLQEKGFVVKNSSKPLAYSALPPSEAFGNYAEHKKKALDSHLGELEGISRFLEKQITTAKSDALEDTDSFLITNRSNIYSKMAAEAQKAAGSVVICSSEEGIRMKKAFFAEKLKGKGVKVNFIADESLPRCGVFGKSRVMLFLSRHGSEENLEKAVFIKSAALAKSLQNLISRCRV